MGLTFKAVLLATTIMAATVAHAGEAPVQRHGYVLTAEQTGNGPVDVVFESGFGQGTGVWKAVIADLGEQCHCVAYARAGLGKSGTDGKTKTIQAHVEDLGAMIDSLWPVSTLTREIPDGSMLTSCARVSMK